MRWTWRCRRKGRRLGPAEARVNRAVLVCLCACCTVGIAMEIRVRLDHRCWDWSLGHDSHGRQEGDGDVKVVDWMVDVLHGFPWRWQWAHGEMASGRWSGAMEDPRDVLWSLGLCHRPPATVDDQSAHAYFGKSSPGPEAHQRPPQCSPPTPGAQACSSKL